MTQYEHKCQHCGNYWKSNVENPKRCKKCTKLLKYKTKYVKSGGEQKIRVTDKCYSMLLRRKKIDSEPLNGVIHRLVNENKFSETISYKHENVIHQIDVKPELLMQIYEIANKYNIKSVNEVIWRLL